MSCCSVNFDTQKLVVVEKDGSVSEAYIGDGVEKEAQELFAAMKNAHPEIAYGKS